MIRPSPHTISDLLILNDPDGFPTVEEAIAHAQDFVRRAFTPAADSPLIDAGVDLVDVNILSSQFQDLFGNGPFDDIPDPWPGETGTGAVDIGAIERMPP